MNIKNLMKKSLDFTIKRVAEIVGISFILISVLLLISLISYSAEDPNFIFTENTKIKNLLGYRGSYISDLFFQSVGLVSFLISLTIFFTGINLIKNKYFLVIIENIFFTVLYSILGSIFFTTFFVNSFFLSINGNGGFVGVFFQNTFLINLINLNKEISFFVLLVLILFIFLISINFSIKFLINIFKKIFTKITKENKKNIISTVQYNDEKINEDTQKLTQEDLPFNAKISENKYKFKLPSLDYLKAPTKTERNKNQNEDKIDENTLEKILLGFWCRRKN